MEPFTYPDLLQRIFQMIKESKPLTHDTKLQVPVPKVSRQNRQTIWANFEQTCQVLQRSKEHVQKVILSELSTSGSLDAHNQLRIQGRFREGQIQNLVSKYILEYVKCRICKQCDTQIVRDADSRLDFIVCNKCRSRICTQIK